MKHRETPGDDWFQRLEDDFPRVEAAMIKWCAGDTASRHKALELAACIAPFYERTGLFKQGQEMLTFITSISDINDDMPTLTHIEVTKWMGIFAWRQGHNKEALLLLEQSLQFCIQSGDDFEKANVLNNLGNVAREMGNYAQARNYFMEIEKLTTDVKDIAMLHNNLGLVDWATQNYEAAIEHFEYSGEIYHLIGNKAGKADVRLNISLVLAEQGQFDVALEGYEEVILLYQNLGNRPLLSRTYNNIGYTYKQKWLKSAATDHYKTAMENFHVSLRMAYDLNTGEDMVNTMMEIAGMIISREPIIATQLFGSAYALSDKRGIDRLKFNYDADDPDLIQLRSILDEPTYLAAWNEGYLMSTLDAVTQALTCTQP